MWGTIKHCVKTAKLALLWFRRILFAPNHFKVNLATKLRMNIFGGYLADQYVLYDLKHNDKKEYLSEFDWYRSRWINEPFDQMFNNKIVCAEVLSRYVAVPVNLVMKNKGRIVSLDPNCADGYKSYSDILDLLSVEEAVFLKPVAAGKGKDVFRLEKNGDEVKVDGESIPAEKFIAFLESRDEWFLSRAVKQHEFLDGIFSGSTNTMRCITLRDPNTGCYKIFFAVLRIGTCQTAPVDNGSRGGLVAKIDIDSGMLSEARSLHSLEGYERHPDSGAQICGSIVPGWDEVKRDILALARRFPFAPFVAWDVLLVEDGVCIIEANASSGVNIVQIWGPQKRGELGDFYRFHGAIR